MRREFYSQAPASRFLFAAISAASARVYQHPLTDFNNNPLVEFGMMSRMLDDAQRRAREALTRASH